MRRSSPPMMGNAVGILGFPGSREAALFPLDECLHTYRSRSDYRQARRDQLYRLDCRNLVALVQASTT